MLRRVVVTVAALVFLPVASTGQGSSGAEVHWPGWRGPGRDGWVSGFRPPTRWPERLKRVWQVEVGTGYASPVVSGGRVYQHARRGDDEVVWCLDLETGTVKWRQSYAAPFTIGGGAERHGKGPKSSPALADGRLFTMSITGLLSAWETATGRLLWRRDYASRFEKGHPYWGAAASPLVDGQRVVAHFGSDGQGALIALDARSGKEIWIHGNDGPSYASPILAEIQGKRQIVGLTMKGLVSVESDSGRLLWKYSYPQVGTNQNMVTPAYHRGLVLLGGENRGIRGLEPRLEGGIWTVQERWHQKKVALDMSSAVVHGDWLYGFSHFDRGRLFCLDAKTGEILWQGPGRTGENVAFLAMTGYVVALINDGELRVIAARGDRLETVASYRVAESPTWAHPVLLENGILVKDSQTLALWSLATVAAGVETKRAGAGHRELRTARVYDDARHLAANRQGRDYWDIYLREIDEQLGLKAEEIPPAALGNCEQLGTYATLLLGDLDPKDLPSGTPANLDQWVRRGGTLIAFATKGLDELCGNRCVGRISQPCDPFTCAATFAMRSDALTEGISSPLQPRQRLLIFSDVQKTMPAESLELARLYDLGGQDTGCAAVTNRMLGKGRVFYFAFGVPQTMWVLHQGRPVYRDWDGDGVLRRSDAIVIRPHSIEVLYADEILFLLGNMIGTHPHPLVHQLPPTQEGEIPDALFFWSGDDEGSATGIQLTASNWMKKHGLPYHINAMLGSGGKFGLSVADAEKIKANGHEIAPHFDFRTGFAPGTGFAREHVLAQAAAFRRHFGTGWTCSVNHTTRWVGWSEPAKWMLEAGGKADNTWVHAGSPPMNPVNLVGFSFGTAFPFWFYDDWKGANQRIDFVEQPITAYECGYRKTRTDFATLHKAIDLAAHYHLTMNMFYHPVYIAEYPACRQAIEEGLRYLNERKIRPLHLGNDGLYEWWKARSQTQVSSVIADGDRLTFEVRCGYPAGMIVKVPLGRRTAESVTVDGKSCVQRLRNERKFGQNWALAVVPRGRSVVNLSLK